MDNSPQQPQNDQKKIPKYVFIVGALVVLVAVSVMAFVLRSDKKTTTSPDYKPVSAVVGTDIPVTIHSDGVSVYFEHNGERLSLANRITDLMVDTEYAFTFTNNSGVKQGVFVPALKESIVVETGQTGTIYLRFTNPGTYYFMGNVYQPGWDGLRSGFDVGDTIQTPPPTRDTPTITPTLTPTPTTGAGGAFTSCADVTEIPQAECQALVDLYNSTNGSGWTNNTGWLQTNTPCSWEGIFCREEGNVTLLTLNSHNLVGTLPSGIGNLTLLEDLNIDDNQLTGNIPTSIGNLTSLQYLSLSNNQLTGSIPTSIGDLKELQHLTLKSNSLSGTMPSELGNLGNLLNFGLDSNQLSGDVPNSFGQLVNLRTLHLASNQLTGVIPSTLRDLTLISGANASFANNQISGVEDRLVCPWLAAHAGQWWSTQNPPLVNDPCQEIAAQPVAARSTGIGKPNTMPVANQNIITQIAIFFQRLLQNVFGK